MSGTESYYAEKIADKLIDIMPIKISKLKPSHTLTYEMDSEDLEIFAEHPKKVEDIYQRAISWACRKYWSAFKHKNLTGTDLKQAIFKDDTNQRNTGMRAFDRIKINLIFYPTITMRQINPTIEKEAIVVDARIMAVGGKIGYVKKASFYCPNEHDTDVEQSASNTLRLFVPKCSECKANMKMHTITAETDFVQTIKVQELDNTLQQSPITFDVKVTGDNVFDTWIGKRIRIAGHFLTDISEVGKKQEHKQYIFAKYIHEIEEVSNVCISKERAYEIKTLLQSPENQTKLFKSFAPAIEGRIAIKESLCYSFVGGSESEVRRIDISILDIGNAGEGKSETIKQIPRVIAKSMYFLGNNATAAGLGIGMVKLDNQTSVPQGGPLVLCSPHGTVVVDELDKMHPEDLKALLSSMEQQIVTKVVAGVILGLPSLVSVVAAANPKYGDWDIVHGIVENINFPPYLLTRFDIVWCSVKTNSIKKQAIASKILNMTPILKDGQLEVLLSEEELLQYVNFCKKASPKLTQAAKIMARDFYLQMSEIAEGEDKVIPMTPRELEGIIRLSTARAKLFQLDEVGIDEVEAIIKLKLEAINSFPGIQVKGGGQQLKLMSETDDKEKLKRNIIIDCKGDDGLVDSAEVINKWVERGVYKTETRATKEFENMEKINFFLRGNRFIYKP